jgi:hypothetical protein
MNVFTACVVGVLVMLSIILTAGVLYPDISSGAITAILGGGVVLGLAGGAEVLVARRRAATPAEDAPTDDTPAEDAPAPRDGDRASWRMPPLALLTRPALSRGRRVGLSVLRGYLVIAVVMVVARIVQLAVSGG